MKKIRPLQSTKLCQKTDLRYLKFKTTDDLPGNTQFVGQLRAVEAMQFSVGIKQDGYNLYAMGPSGVGKRAVIYTTLEEEAKRHRVPSDWCYIHNFSDPQKPTAIRLPPGLGKTFRRDMEVLVEDLCTSIPIVFESEQYRAQLQKIVDTLNARQEKLLKNIKIEAEENGLVIVASPEEFTILPADKKGRAISVEIFAKLPKKIRAEKEELIAEFSDRLTKLLQHIPRLHKEQREKEKEIKKEFTLIGVGHFIDDLKEKYEKFKAVIRYLDAVQEDVIKHVQEFLKREEATQNTSQPPEKNFLARYAVNVLVNHARTKGAPIIYEENPSYANLICKVEHTAQYGTLSTDFTLIRASALHKANGGYLILDAAKVLQDQMAWEGLKRALYSRKITLESPEATTGALSTVSLEPMPIRLNVKVILLGDRLLHYMLCEADPDFNELFKVAADFDEYVPRTSDNLELYTQFIATLIGNEKLHPFDRSAVAAVIDYSARLAEDAGKLSTHVRGIHDVLREADYWARKAKQDVVHIHHVKHAIDAKEHRLGRMKESLYEDIANRIMLIDLQRQKVGQVNGLVVVQLGSVNFGHPCRITARVHVGDGGVIDIQREADLSGAVHSKGVMILAGFLAGHYVPETELSLSASLVFEQMYGSVDGDSATVAETCALLSAIAEVPVYQSLAVTGSLNQFGEVQPVGGVNEKIEGFFDVCKMQGLTGEQGVIIPAGNVRHLMLKDAVVVAVANKKFHIYAVNTIDEVLTLLSDMPAGVRGKAGQFSRGSFNERVEKRLTKFAKIQDGDRHAKQKAVHRKKHD